MLGIRLSEMAYISIFNRMVGLSLVISWRGSCSWRVLIRQLPVTDINTRIESLYLVWQVRCQFDSHAFSELVDDASVVSGIALMPYSAELSGSIQ
jgi:hypothetical protein